jgi:hypothetical protein
MIATSKVAPGATSETRQSGFRRSRPSRPSSSISSSSYASGELPHLGLDLLRQAGVRVEEVARVGTEPVAKDRQVPGVVGNRDEQDGSVRVGNRPLQVHA